MEVALFNAKDVEVNTLSSYTKYVIDYNIYQHDNSSNKDTVYLVYTYTNGNWQYYYVKGRRALHMPRCYFCCECLMDEGHGWWMCECCGHIYFRHCELSCGECKFYTSKRRGAECVVYDSQKKDFIIPQHIVGHHVENILLKIARNVSSCSNHEEQSGE